MNIEKSMNSVDKEQVLESLHSAIILLDRNMHILYLNSYAEVIIGISAKQILNVNLKNLLTNDPDLVEKIISAADEEQSCTIREQSISFVSGKSVLVDYTVSLLGENQILLEISQIDHQRRITKEEQFFAQSHAMNNLAKGLAHEVRNPLGGLRGAAQLLEKELDDEDLKEYTKIIIGEADRLQNLVSRILGDSKYVVKKVQVNIHQVLEHVRQLLLIDNPKDIEFFTDYDPSIPDVNIWQDQLIQAILNISRNAVEAVQTGGMILFCTRVVRQAVIGAHRYKLAVKIDIQDNGSGIDEELMDSIFLPMISSRPNGTGLGLSISQSIIFRHGGIIECESKPGRTVFSIIIPLEYEHGEKQ